MYRCHRCSDLPRLEVLTTELSQVVHIYYQLVLGSSSVYYIRLVLNENYTAIFRYWTDFTQSKGQKEILRLPGFPITHQNIETKLKTYLTFL